MSTPILTTKLYIPPPRSNAILRPRLIVRLNEGLHRKLILIAAPAGFGKTTLVSEWVASLSSEFKVLSSEFPEPEPTQNVKLKTQNLRVAWLSLDEGERDLTRFLTYLVAALQTIAPTMGAGVLGVLQSALPPPSEAILTALLNEISTMPDHFILVLDDYHVIDAQSVDHALAFVLEHMPPVMHLVITTREDPQIPLARLRARDQITELRAADLRFTLAEAALFLTEVMDLDLSAADIAALEAHTEGWIAGLQLAALSMGGRADVGQFVREFAGDNRYIVGYLVEEVLQRQPERVRSFLLQTSMLDRLHGPLCDAVTGQEGGSTRLEALEHGNFFLIPLDDKRHWYRYHHLFAEVLHMHLMAEQPDQVPALHRRASEWYEQNGSAEDAIRHALAGRDFERAAGLIELASTTMSRNRQEATLLGWMQALPEELFRARPVLSVTYAHVLMASGKVEGVKERLRDAEWWLDTTAERRVRPNAPAGEMVVVDETAFGHLPGTIAIARAGLALARGDVPQTMTYAQQALDLAPEDDHRMRGGAAGFLGLAYWTSGDLEAAHRTYADGMASLQKAGNISDAINGATTLAAIRIAQGRLHDAMRTYEQALQLAMERGTPGLRGTADMYVGMSEILRERNDLHAATQHLLRTKEMGEHTAFPQNRYRWRVAMARIREAQGNLDGALDLLDDAERLYMSDFPPNVHPIVARKTRVWLAQERLGEALDWARVQRLSVQDDLSYVREFEHITLARVLLAQYRNESADHSIVEAIGLLERLLAAAQEGGRMGSVIEILILEALAHEAQGNIPVSLIPLEQALTLAEPEGYIRMFLDEGTPMAQLLREAAAHEIRPGYTGKLLVAFEAQGQKSANASPIPASPTSQSLIEPLSQRELEVLRLFKTELSGPEIARELTIALSTVRTHTESIYSKLNVKTRRAAVQRAIELNLI